MLVPAYLQPILNTLTFEEDIDSISYEEAKAEGDKYKASESYNLAIKSKMIERNFLTMIFKRHKSYDTKEGYTQVYKPKSPEARENGYAPLHRVKASKKLGRPLRSDEVVHHIDGNKKNNRKSNLQVMSKSEHYKIHHDYNTRKQ